MTAMLAVIPQGRPDGAGVPVQWPRPQWTHEVEPFSGNVIYRSRWSEPIACETLDHGGKILVRAQLTAADELQIQPDGSVVADREVPEVQIEIDGQVVVYGTAEALGVLGEALVAFRDAARSDTAEAA